MARQQVTDEGLGVLDFRGCVRRSVAFPVWETGVEAARLDRCLGFVLFFRLFKRTRIPAIGYRLFIVIIIIIVILLLLFGGTNLR